jgi:hypothetical protein
MRKNNARHYGKQNARRCRPVLGGYRISVQNRVGYHPVLSVRTGWVPSGGIPEMILTFQSINLVTTGSFRIGLLKNLDVHTWEVILIT